MKTIWKYQLAYEAAQHLSVPSGAVFLDAQEQYGVIALWFEVDPDRKPIQRAIYVVPTGAKEPPPASAVYLKTVQMNGGALVWHVYIEPDDPF